jgi:DNA mismatch endonuclease (patch repair protein)
MNRRIKAENPRWGSADPLVEIWRTGPRTAAENSVEQDRAAGGREQRRVPRGDGTFATASVALKHWAKSRRVYAYLRYWYDGRTEVRYLGDVTCRSRDEALQAAWRIAKERGLLATRKS